jgi:hypothetical protein
MKILSLLLGLLGTAFMARAGFYQVSGTVSDSTGAPLSGASIALLNPEDSTLATFAISNKGTFYNPRCTGRELYPAGFHDGVLYRIPEPSGPA